MWSDVVSQVLIFSLPAPQKWESQPWKGRWVPRHQHRIRFLPVPVFPMWKYLQVDRQQNAGEPTFIFPKSIFSSSHAIATIQENIFDTLSVLTLSFPSTSDLSTGNHQVQWKSCHAMSVTSNTAPTPVWNSTLDKSIRIGTLDESLVTSHAQNVERYIPTRLACGNTRRAFME